MSVLIWIVLLLYETTIQVYEGADKSLTLYYRKQQATGLKKKYIFTLHIPN
jgi:tRNA(Met) C34 N-acetyltransferase TmcA